MHFSPVSVFLLEQMCVCLVLSESREEKSDMNECRRRGSVDHILASRPVHGYTQWECICFSFLRKKKTNSSIMTHNVDWGKTHPVCPGNDVIGHVKQEAVVGIH